MVLSFYTECLGGNCKKPGEYDVIINEPLRSDNIVEDSAADTGGTRETGHYHRWVCVAKKSSSYVKVPINNLEFKFNSRDTLAMSFTSLQ